MRRFGLVVAAILLAAPALAGPTVFTHQGRLLDSTGQPLTGQHAVQVSLFSGSTGVAEWSETRTVSMSDGYYSLVLGEDPGNLIEAEDFGSTGPQYVELAIDGVPLGARRPLGSTPLALRATTATSVDGGTVDASEVRIGGEVVIDGTGAIGVERVPGAQQRVSGSCSVGQAIRQINADGTVVCGQAGGAIGSAAGPAAAQLVGPAQALGNASWKTVELASEAVGSGLSTVGSSLFFDSPGVYRITLDYRGGGGTDIWTGVRLYGDHGTRGVSAGYGVNGPSSPDVFGVTFLATVVNADVPYEIQHGRLGEAQSVVTPNAIDGQVLPAVTATVERVGALNDDAAVFADLHADASSFAGSAWTPIPFNGAGALAGTTVGAGNTVTFDTSGPMQFDVTYRLGTGTDVWTGFALFSGATPVGRSVAYGNLPTSHEVTHASFIADVVAGVPYTLRLGRRDSGFTTHTPTPIGGQSMPSLAVVATPVDPAAHAQLDGPGQVFPAGWTPVDLSEGSVGVGISASGSDVTFSEAGVYRIAVGYRNGVGADTWTGVRVVDDEGTVVGVSTGYGNDVNTVDLQAVQFLADIASPGVYRIELGRLGASLTVASAADIVGVAMPSIVAVVTRVEP